MVAGGQSTDRGGKLRDRRNGLCCRAPIRFVAATLFAWRRASRAADSREDDDAGIVVRAGSRPDTGTGGEAVADTQKESRPRGRRDRAGDRRRRHACWPRSRCQDGAVIRALKHRTDRADGRGQGHAATKPVDFRKGAEGLAALVRRRLALICSAVRSTSSRQNERIGSSLIFWTAPGSALRQTPGGRRVPLAESA